MARTKRDLIERMFSEVWEKKNSQVLDEILSPGLKPEDDLFFDLAPRRDYLLLVDVIHSLVGPLKLKILRFLETGDWAMVHFSLTAPGRQLQTPVSVEGMFMARFENDLLAEVISQIDCFKFFEQLGQLPPEAMAACLTGQELTWK